MTEKKAKGFILKHKEKAEFNQYWYSEATIAFLAKQALQSESACFLSTPSIFFSIENISSRKGFYVFDLDEKFGIKNSNYFKYDFNCAEDIPEQFENSFEFVLADPPFITKQVWEKYAIAIKKLIKKDEQGNIIGRLLLSTIDENEETLLQLLGVKRRNFKPSIPHLVYQYSLYSNYEDQDLDSSNPEISQ